jgi:prepilin-type N-terminal cleavage/methylation domain-containing protein
MIEGTMQSRWQRIRDGQRFSRRDGFSLVELLVVIGILGSIVGMLLPAVQRAREASRRMACGNQIKNMGLAVMSYESGRKAYPPGWDARPLSGALPAGTGFAWSAYVLPYLEESAIFSLIDFKKVWNDAGGNAVVADRDVPIYKCPNGIVKFPGQMDYGGIMGHSIVLSGQANVIDNAWNSGILVAVNNGSIPTVRAAAVSDGLSHTLIVAESVDRVSYTTSDENIRWAWGANSFPQCETFVNSFKAGNIRSYHDGGAFGVFADGSVTFLNNSLDRDILAAICSRNGGETNASAVSTP